MGPVCGEIWAWVGLSIKRNIANLIPLNVFLVLWKERNDRAFDSKASGLYRLRDRWIYYFGITLLVHDIITDKVFENVIDTLTLL